MMRQEGRMGIFSPDAHHVCATISIRPNAIELLRAELMSAYHFRPNVDVSCLMVPRSKLTTTPPNPVRKLLYWGTSTSIRILNIKEIQGCKY